MKKGWFVSFWAALHVVAGLLMVSVSLLLAVWLVWEAGPGSRPALVAGREPVAAVVVVLIGLLLGAPFIVSGQLLDVFVDQRQLLSRIHRRLRALEQLERERDEIERAMRRRSVRAVEPPARARPTVRSAERLTPDPDDRDRRDT